MVLVEPVPSDAPEFEVRWSMLARLLSFRTIGWEAVSTCYRGPFGITLSLAFVPIPSSTMEGGVWCEKFC